MKFSVAADRSALGLNGAVPRDLQKFITTATSSHQAAQGAAYTAVLTKAGIPAADLTADLAALKALGELHSQFDTKAGDAQQATEARDTAHDAMAKWVSDTGGWGRSRCGASPVCWRSWTCRQASRQRESKRRVVTSPIAKSPSSPRRSPPSGEEREKPPRAKPRSGSG